MKRRLLFFAVIFFSSGIFAQGFVEIFTDPDIEAMENARIAKRRAADGKVKGYRIMVGFYSSRSAATEKLAEARMYFENSFGVVLLYEEPNFKVYVGEFTSRIEADEALVAIRKKYPGARIIEDMVVPPRYR